MRHTKISLTFLALFFLFAPPLFGAKGDIVETREGEFFSLIPPKGWNRIVDKEQLPAKIDAVYIGAGKGGFTPSINIATEKTTLNPTEYVALARRYHETQSETRCDSLGKLETKAGAAELLQIDRNTQWGGVRFIQATLVRNGIAYVLTATCLSSEFSNLATCYFQAIQSFAIHSPEEGKKMLSQFNRSSHGRHKERKMA